LQTTSSLDFVVSSVERWEGLGEGDPFFFLSPHLTSPVEREELRVLKVLTSRYETYFISLSKDIDSRNA
jgi:hypothetical protein